MTVFNTEKYDHTKEYMFFGKELGVARYDVVKHMKFEKLVDQQQGYFWRPSEIDLSKDRFDFNHKLSEVDKRIFISNLQYQTLLDSVQGRSPLEVLLPICSLPELEDWLVNWAFSELVHSRSYTHIIRNVFTDPSVVFDGILDIPEIMNRAAMVTKYYDELAELVDYYKVGEVFKESLYLPLFKCMIAIYALEAIRFYVSFACSYSFNERQLMEGNAKIIGLINRDEFLHQGGTHFILTRWLRGLDDPEMTRIARGNIHLITEIFQQTAEQEKEWARWLFKDGSVIGLNEKVLCSYIDYRTDKCLADLGLPLINNITVDPLPWVSAYTNSANVQVAPQETELSSYIVGGLDSNLEDLEFDL
jgi:ribonucleoside-diphosphate reductase beta chain